MTGLDKLEHFRVARCVKPDGIGMSTQAELHHFSDASDHAYGTASYLRLTEGKHTVHVAFILGKARVAPLKQTTIPRLELVAAILAVGVDRMLRKELDITLNSSTFWTDSQTVLKYVANKDTRFCTFVANRISVIRENIDVTQWKFIGTKLNPADLASRGMCADTFIKCSNWIHGPEFLWKPEDEWPQNPLEAMPLTQDDLEVKRCTAVYSAVIKTQNNPTWQLLEYFSSWNKLKRAVVWYLNLRNLLLVLSVNRKIQGKVSPHPQTRSQSKMLNSKRKAGKNKPGGQRISLDDLMKAEKAIVVFYQHQSYPEEIAKLEKTEFVGKGLRRISTIYKLDPVLEDGVLRVGLSKAAMPGDAKRPMILPEHIHVSTLILRHIHEQLGHGGRNHVLSQLRKRCWIVNANSAACKVISKCVVRRCVCEGRIGEQKMANLPKERLEADLSAM